MQRKLNTLRRTATENRARNRQAIQAGEVSKVIPALVLEPLPPLQDPVMAMQRGGAGAGV